MPITAGPPSSVLCRAAGARILASVVRRRVRLVLPSGRTAAIAGLAPAIAALFAFATASPVVALVLARGSIGRGLRLGMRLGLGFGLRRQVDRERQAPVAGLAAADATDHAAEEVSLSLILGLADDHVAPGRYVEQQVTLVVRDALGHDLVRAVGEDGGIVLVGDALAGALIAGAALARAVVSGKLDSRQRLRLTAVMALEDPQDRPQLDRGAVLHGDRHLVVGPARGGIPATVRGGIRDHSLAAGGHDL